MWTLRGLIAQSLSALLFAMAIFSCAQASGEAPPASVFQVSAETLPDSSRIVIKASRKPVTAVNTGLAPVTMQIDLQDAVLSPDLAQFFPVNDGRIKGVEIFQYDRSRAKVTIGLVDGHEASVSSRGESPYEIIVEVR